MQDYYLPGVLAEELLVAADFGDALRVKALIEKGVDVTVRDASSGCTALHLAASSGHAELLRVLLSCPALDVLVSAPAADGQTPLHHAAQALAMHAAMHVPIAWHATAVCAPHACAPHA